MLRLAAALALLLAATPALAPPAAEDLSADYGRVHIYPEGQEVCSAFDNICTVRI